MPRYILLVSERDGDGKWAYGPFPNHAPAQKGLRKFRDSPDVDHEVYDIDLVGLYGGFDLGDYSEG